MTAASSLRSAPLHPPIAPQNTAIVRSLYAAFSRLARGGGIASYVTAHFHSDCEYRPVEEAGTIRGHGALIRWIERWLEAWDDAWDEIDEIIVTGRMVVAAIRVHGRGRKSGMEISQRLFDVFELRDDRVLRITEYLDPGQALGAAGLPGITPPLTLRDLGGRPTISSQALADASISNPRYRLGDVAGERRDRQGRPRRL